MLLAVLCIALWAYRACYVCLSSFGKQAQRAHGQWVPYIDKGGKGIFYYNKVYMLYCYTYYLSYHYPTEAA
jgi:hypothetical protein